MKKLTIANECDECSSPSLSLSPPTTFYTQKTKLRKCKEKHRVCFVGGDGWLGLEGEAPPLSIQPTPAPSLLQALNFLPSI